MWSSEKLDLNAYLNRIGYTGDTPRPDLATLRKLHRAHVEQVPFENLEIMLGRPVLLDLESLQDKMITRRRGGYCHEQNSLFAAVLERIGYTLTGRAGRVVQGEPGKILPPTHMLLIVEIDGERWLADVGFGSEGPRLPIRLRENEEVRHGEWSYALGRDADGVWMLRGLRPEGWVDLYSFTEDPAFPPDYFVYNYYVSTHSRSPFTRRPVVQVSAMKDRTALLGSRLAVIRPDGTTDEREVSGSELGSVLDEVFGLTLSEEELAVLGERQRAIGG
ncbi:arylamine N-acetyltransferase family protein [Streptomyces chumphonensis]|uniref:arylamine N-acetyltransferase family protein n=1 Tax=Streptomyces chumphonensis TaxID=1214925 RepID=UPI003D755AB6